jgi:capsular polysaccharide biosynthesis protein
LAEKAGLRDCVDYYLVPNIEHPFQLETLNLLGIPREKLISSVEKNHIIADDLIATSHPNVENTVVMHRVRSWVPVWLKNTLGGSGSANDGMSDLVYIERGDGTTGRGVTNEAEVLEMLKKKGFRGYRLSELSFKQQIGLFTSARIVIGAHGAGLSNIVFCQPGTKVIELFSEKYIPSVFKNTADILDLDYHAHISEEYEDGETPQRTSFRASIKALDELSG